MSARAAANLSGVSIIWRGLRITGYQPSPSRAVRLRAAMPSPPIHIGGPPACNGFGSKDTFLKDTKSPSYTGAFSVQRTLKASIYSFDAAPRRSKAGALNRASSSRIQPTPTPAVIRPFDSKSAVASCFAVWIAGRCGITITDVSSRIFSVTAAA